MERLVDLPRPYSPLAPIRTRRVRSGPGAAGLEAHRRAAEIVRIASQLARVAETVSWGRVQDDRWDQLSRFVYRTRSAAAARTRAEQVAAELGPRLGDEPRAFVHYALRRWYCFWGARLAELLFLGHAGVRPGPPKHHEIDFTIDGVPFDLKTTEVPRAFAGPPEAWLSDPGKLATWLYRHQSREGRFHTANRLFLVLCDPERPAEAWRLRGDVRALAAAIDGFMARRRFGDLLVPDGAGGERRVITAVVPVLPLAEAPRQLSLNLGVGRTPDPPRRERGPLQPRLL
ncbi:MAG TPA: hypothetical protein VG370_19145 [Chloroflexota bacterium]|nr:hypothetical protein [Chloroflexota bacterium]